MVDPLWGKGVADHSTSRPRGPYPSSRHQVRRHRPVQVTAQPTPAPPSFDDVHGLIQKYAHAAFIVRLRIKRCPVVRHRSSQVVEEVR